VNSVDVARDQFGYLEGYIAGKVTKSGKVGVVSGLEGLPVTVATVGGFRKGVEAANPDATVTVVYLPDMEDAAAAKQAVGALASSGVDVVLPFLNGGVVGAIQGAGEKGIYTFGRGEANTDLAPKAVLTNVQEDWPTIYLATAKLFLDGKLTGSHVHYGYDSEASTGTTGASLVYKGGQAFNPAVPEEVQAQLEDIEQQMASGALTVEPTADDARAGS
jgi:simple sugar transport system substrate-binding protein/basic membrane protein A